MREDTNAAQRDQLLPLVVGETHPSLRRILSQEGIPWRDRERGEPQGRFLLFDSAINARQTVAAGQVAIDMDEIRASSADDPFVALDDTRARRAVWQIGGYAVSEEVSRRDKRELRRKVIDRLRARVEEAGGIWLRVAAVPFPYRAAFSFRFDHDEFVASDFDGVMDAIRGHEHATTHFVCGSTHEGQVEALARLRGLDVGSHGYWHHTYADQGANQRNIARGIEALRGRGIEPSGFAAPHGRYHDSLPKILGSLGVSHSSEFGLAYDDWPFFEQDARVLQIPIHPICLGIFLEAAAAGGVASRDEQTRAAEAVANHLCRVAETKYQGGEPIFLYGHPDRRLGRHTQVLQRVFATVDGFAAVWKTNYSQFARWWRRRAEVRVRAYRAESEIVVLAEGLPPDFRVAVEVARGDHVAPLPLSDRVMRFSPDGLVFQNRRPRSPHSPRRFDRLPSLRASVLRLLDWETTTPLDELSTDNWKGWVKHRLRTVRDERLARAAEREAA